MKHVYVVIAKPRNGNQEFIYGVFANHDHAIGHYELHGDKDCDYRTSCENIITEV